MENRGEMTGELISIYEKPSINGRALNLVTAIWHKARWGWRFREFGFRSRLGSCAMLTNPGQISIGRRVLIRKGSRLEAIGGEDHNGVKIVINDGTAAQFNFHCAAAKSVVIGRDVLIAGNVYITDHDHVFDDPEVPAIRSGAVRALPVVIEEGAWLGENCVILKGVRVGRRAVVAANAVVTKDVPAYSVVAGVPGRIVRRIEQAG